MTGLYFTTILYNGSGAVTWAGAMAMCKGVSSGDGTSLWRLPTQKELMQLYIDGISRLTVAGGSWSNQSMWSLSATSNFSTAAWIVSLNYGDQTNLTRPNTSRGVICVR